MTQMRDILQSRSVILKNVSCHKRKTEKSVLIKGDKRYDNQILCKITDWILGLWEKKNIIRTTEKNLNSTDSGIVSTLNFLILTT